VANLDLGESFKGAALVKYLGHRWRDRRSRARRGGAKRWSAERGWGLGRGAVAPSQYGGLGAMPPEKFSKNQR